MSRALFIGRFQPFHNAHLIDIKNILKEYDEIIIAIGSSNEKNTPENPFSYAERREMIKKALLKNKISNFKIYPSPDFYDDNKWIADLRKRLPSFGIAYSGNPYTIRCFGKHKIKVKKIRLIRGVSSTRIREMMVKGEKWERLVPKEVSGHLKKAKGLDRLGKIYSRL
ncbi:nicotinamide-nucleotide adenylyltransferase [Candidatus Woesearchaeota archaeon]|nr:nicotinamide-nucleotide adenylyltransferase [Candidatus Woesearchaeota archaeon]